MTKNYKAPCLDTDFSCPHCGALAKQQWSVLLKSWKDKDYVPRPFRDDLEEFLEGPDGKEIPDAIKSSLIEGARKERDKIVHIEELSSYTNSKLEVRELHISECYNCDRVAVWIAKELVYPVYDAKFVPARDMPDLVKRDFVEASKLFRISPRASSALLRVAIEQLCNEINGQKLSVFKGIGKLVEAGLDPRLQKALDFVRVTGNDAVHPGQITSGDSSETAEKLFSLVNLIVERLITVPNEIEKLYETIPEGKRAAIEKRDKSK